MARLEIGTVDWKVASLGVQGSERRCQLFIEAGRSPLQVSVLVARNVRVLVIFESRNLQVGRVTSPSPWLT
jgi:hypothetical protein